ncbi:caltractin-like [Ischnura elegans]|uniref:caltractin-like n=1 Tax=Ischnura elegans TaxID=197161 RepID=UPI001ED8B6FA|nr:caltractin-like [Ischnura elegans]
MNQQNINSPKMNKPSAKEKRRKKAPLFEFTKEQLNDLKIAFEVFDQEGTGLLPANYLRIILRAFGFESDREAINHLLCPLAKDYDDKLNYEEFESIIRKLMSEELPLELQVKAFHLYNHNISGKISFEELKQVSSDLGDNVTEETIHDMVWGATKGLSEEVDLDDFQRILKQPEPF